MNSAIENQAYKTAVEASIKASKHIMRYWSNSQNPLFDKNLLNIVFDKTVGTGNYATLADKQSEKIILKEIRNQPLLATHTFLGEESESQEDAYDCEWTWIVDPIDGTLSFNNGIEIFGVSIGVFKDTKPFIGVIALPVLGQLIASQKGQGAKLLDFEGNILSDLIKEEKGRNVPVNKALLGYDLGYTGREKLLKGTIAKIADSVGYTPYYASFAWANCKLAQGMIHGYLHEQATWYDMGAALTIIPETGGKVTDIDGKSISLTKNPPSYLAARTPEIHKKLLELIHQ